MHFSTEYARTQTVTARERITEAFGQQPGGLDAEFFSGHRKAALGFADLPYEAPLCARLMNRPATASYLAGFSGNQLFWLESGNDVRHRTEAGEQTVPEDVAAEVLSVCRRVLSSPGQLNEKGELLLDLKAYPVGPHYPVNLLLGNRAGYPYPLCTTPKSALDALGRGSFRGTGGTQVLATRCTLQLEENGEPANRQFYLVENGKQIFYSANVEENVTSAHCLHSQNRTIITYETACGLTIRRTIFLLPQEPGMPNAVEAQRVEVENHSGRDRTLSIVMTGVFGVGAPLNIANDVVCVNVVHESAVCYDGDSPAALTIHFKPAGEQSAQRFAALLCNGESFDGFCTSLSDFVGCGTLEHPELIARLPNRYSRKTAPFFALEKTFNLKTGESTAVDEFVGMLEEDAQAADSLDNALRCLLEKYRDPAALSETFQSVAAFWDRYPAYLQPETGDQRFDAYVGRNLPFQVLYQTYVSRAFAWTQKSYRETGFREIQDIYASMDYLSAMGENGLIKELLSNWIRSVFRMGYAYHDFTFQGKEPGDCSDDQLWLVQAVYRYVKLTGDTSFLLEEYPIAGEDAKRPLWETLMAILTYSGNISVGLHGLPLLDKADWNDTLRLDREVMKGPEKERRYREQLAEKGQAYGVPFENTLCESVMNACLLRIAADEVSEMASLIGKTADGKTAAALSRRIYTSMQENAWKGDFFARCLINDGRPYTYLGAGGDGLSLDPSIDGSYYLNSYSWSMDCWITAAGTPKQILENYTAVTGRAGMFPEDLMGLWQCKLRYRTQEEVLEVARRYQAEGIKIDQIVIDFFHWTVQGDWKFDKTYWPDPKAMVEELHAMGMKVIVSVWPSVDRRSENFYPMLERGLLMRTERGALQTYDYQGDCVEIDAFNPEARKYIWEVCKRNYYDLGIDAFWLDNSEPDLGVYDFDHYRYYAGPALRVSNLYPQMLSRAFYDEMSKLQEAPVVNLLRCGWAGSQKYGNVIWSGDVPSTFEAFADQIQCGLNMGLAGISWWTTDIGGFMTDDVNDPDFRQLLIRWYQFAVYSPVLRMHGDRGPYDIPPLDERDWGGGYLHIGQPNELWSYGEENYAIMRKYYDLRISMHDYIKSLYAEAHENGSPLLRAMFYEFPEDGRCWELQDQYMFGAKYLAAPILQLNQFRRDVYLPAGQWKLTSTGEVFQGGQTVTVDAPLAYMPVFERL